MQDIATLKKHAALFDEMGAALGLDLQQQAINGGLPRDEISEAVLRCIKCAHPEQCTSLLAVSSPQPVAPPDYCRNRDLLTYLGEQES